MRSWHAIAKTIVRSDSTASNLGGRWLVLARAVWAILVVLILSLFVMAIPALYTQRLVPSNPVRMGLAQLSLPASFYAGYWVAIHIVFAVVYFIVAAVIAWRKPDEPLALFVSLFLVLLGGANAATTGALLALHPGLFFIVTFSFFLTVASLILFFFLFPDGRFVPRWLRIPVLVWMAGALFISLLPDLSPADGSPSSGIALMFVGGLVTAGAAQIYRYLRVSNPVQRQQTKWIVFGATVAVVGQIAAMFLGDIFPSLTESGPSALLYDLANVTIIVLSFLLIPLSIGFAILRYRLWDIDIIINRALVYGALTVSIVGLYILVVGGLGMLLQAHGNLLISLLAAALVAMLFAPLHDRLQRGVNRLMYGERDDPYAVLSQLGQRLEATLAPDAVLPTIVETVKEALKLPYVAIALGMDERQMTNDEPVSSAEDTFAIVTANGMPVATPLKLPLVYQTETVGQLILGPRSPSESFSPAEQRLLNDLARQAGIAAYAVRLTADLQRARERLVMAREEERRRLRNDLHDGVGPQLASLTLKLETARNRLSHDPAADALLSDLAARTQTAVADIRRLVYALRPPALDELGLVSALHAGAAQYAGYGSNGLQITIDAPEHLPPLPAAVEVAAYRITQEALANVVRHAQAHTCVIRLTLNEMAGLLCLEVQDDGRGLPADHRAGVGLHSMRERAAELGGSCVIESVPEGGTRVLAWLPVAF